jgi:hypothetical protein
MVHGRNKGRGFFRAFSANRFFTALFLLLLIFAIGRAEAGTPKGRFAFYYTGSFTNEELAWFQRFDIVVPGYILPDAQIDVLHQAGSRLFSYTWSTGTYFDNPAQLNPNSWEAQVYKNRRTWLLNPNRPDSGPDGLFHAYYYDTYPSSFKQAWAQFLDTARLSASYEGIFFDLVGSLYVPSYLQKVYSSRHPKTNYNSALAEVFRSLRNKGSAIFTNQGYRMASYYLPVTDYDLTESLMTSYAWGTSVQIYAEGQGLVERQETFYQPWLNLKAYVGDIQTKVDRYNPAVQILHLNYTNPAYQATGKSASVNGVAYPIYREVIDRPAIYYGYVAAKLWGHDSYSYGPTVRFSQDEIYFTDLGGPLGNSYEERNGVVLRYYENGVVALNPSTASQTVDLSSPLVPPGVAGLQDLYDNVTVFGLTVTIDPTVSSASGRVYPSGRVYLYRS